MTLCYDPYVGTLGNYTSDQIFAMVDDAGYEGINLHVSEPFFSNYDTGELDAIEALAQRHGLEIPSLYFGRAIITDPTLEVEVSEHFAFCLDVARRFGARVIGLWPNLPEGLFVEDALETLARNLQSMAESLGDENILLTLEFERGCPLDNYLMTLSYLEACDQRVSIACDTHHLNNHQADPYRAVLKMGGKLGEVHLSGTHRLEPGSVGDSFDYPTFMRGLTEIGYDGPLTAQYHLEDPASLKRVRTLMNNLRK